MSDLLWGLLRLLVEVLNWLVAAGEAIGRTIVIGAILIVIFGASRLRPHPLKIPALFQVEGATTITGMRSVGSSTVTMTAF
jgi:hypothetical protein